MTILNKPDPISIDDIKIQIINYSTEIGKRFYVLDDMWGPTTVNGGQGLIAQSRAMRSSDTPTTVAKYLVDTYAAVAFYETTVHKTFEERPIPDVDADLDQYKPPLLKGYNRVLRFAALTEL